MTSPAHHFCCIPLPRNDAGCEFRRIQTIPHPNSSSPKRRRLSNLSVRCQLNANSDDNIPSSRRRDVLVTPLLALGACFLQSVAARADETHSEVALPAPEKLVTSEAKKAEEKKAVPVLKEEVISSRIYDATVIGEPLALGKEKAKKVLDKLMSARIVYLGEAEQVPIKDDKDLELEIIKSLKKRCFEMERTLSLALEAFPCNLQEQLNQYIEKREAEFKADKTKLKFHLLLIVMIFKKFVLDESIDGETLRLYTSHWPAERWKEYEPLLTYCRDNGVRLVACGTPLQVLRTVQSESIRGLSKADRKTYAPPTGSGFISGFTSISRRSSLDLNNPYQSAPFGPSSYLSAQARVVEDYTMSQAILQATVKGGANGMLVVITGASHVTYGTRGTGLLARISKNIQKKNQVVILLDPERQYIRREGEVPVADFLWYSAARPCSRNCFGRAEIARVMNAAGMKRDALPQDLQQGLDLGLVSPEVLQNFFDLEQYPLLAEVTHRFQGFRERLLADPKFLHRLAIEESISVTTTLIAQYERRKENFFEEIDYVITDTVRGVVVDFFTVWLPAPTLSFLSYADETNAPDGIDPLKGLLGSIPDNAFQRNLAGKDWDLNHRIASVVVGGLKLSSVGFISSIGAVASSNLLFSIRSFLNPAMATNEQRKRSPILKTAVVYGSFLGLSANLRYQIIAGLVEHRLSKQFASQTLIVNMISFIARTINSYWGTQQWIDLARFTGLQTRKSEEAPESASSENQDGIDQTAFESNTAEEASVEELQNQ